MAASKKHNQRRLFATAGFLVAGGLIAYGLSGFWQQHKATHEANPTITTAVITHSTDRPSETKPVDACAKYKPEPQYPERIAIGRIDAVGCLERVGIDQEGRIAVPDNIYTAAWYTKSALPGEEGLSVIVGHISGYYNKDGIFQRLHELRPGDEFTVTLGSGRLLRYEVFKEQSVPLDKAVSVILAKDPGVSRQLNLVTCGGTYNKATKLYDHRIIVMAKLLP